VRDIQTQLANEAAGECGETYAEEAFGWKRFTYKYDTRGDGTTLSNKIFEQKTQWFNTVYKNSEGLLLTYSLTPTNANKCLTVAILIWVVPFPCGVVKTYLMPKDKRKEGLRYRTKAGKPMMGCKLENAVEIIGKIDSAPDELDKRLWNEYELHNTSRLYAEEDGTSEKIALEITKSLPKIEYSEL